MIVVDCTVIADFFIGNAEMQMSVQSLLEMDSEWIAPVLWRYEFGNVLLKEVRGGRMSADLMDRYLAAGEKLIFESVVDFDASKIAEMSRARDLSFYDASYVWLGQARGLPFYTRDGKLARKCEGLVQPMPVGE
ncbi:MAG: PIN domain-containing protein [Verrucomicrobia bacterium]|nr:MAG: PIN domain-containing protein [Verrucomicrobiota bacterium]